jgi:hypothetical protein
MTTLSTAPPSWRRLARLPGLRTRAESRPRLSGIAAAGFGLLALVRSLTLPRGPWELDEMLFAGAVRHFEPLRHWPHPPGYPLFVGLGKALDFAVGDPFVSLAALSLLASLAAYWALVAAFRRLSGGAPGGEQVAVAGALLFLLSPAMLVQAPLALSDTSALMFVSLALAAAGALADEPTTAKAAALGAAASAAIGCRPQLALAVLPMLAVALLRPAWRRRLEALAAFAVVSLLWLVPLVIATGGPRGFVAYQAGQLAYVAGHDADLSRAATSVSGLLARFVAHPWGPKWIAIPVLALATLGALDGWRRRCKAALPLAALSGAQLLACLALMDPADAVRYSLPWTLGVAFAAAAGAGVLARRAGRPALAWAASGAILLAGAAYAWPVLAARAREPSPPLQAARWANRHLPPGATVLMEPEVQAHGRYLLADFDLAPVQGGLDRAAARSERPLWLFAEGESRRPGAANFAWPDSDAYRRLTRNHYRVVSLTPLVPDFFQAVRGVHDWEPSALDPRWRWLQRAATLRVFPRGAAAIALTLGLPSSAPLSANVVTVAVDGATIAMLNVERGASRRIEIPVAKKGPLFVTIRSASTFTPERSADGRALAVQLLAIERLER